MLNQRPNNSTAVVDAATTSDVGPDRSTPASRGGGRVKVAAEDVCRQFQVGRSEVMHALGPIDLDIADGEFACLVGPSGCGKSTFLKVVAGLVRPTSGEVHIEVGDPGRVPIAMVFQDYGIYPWKTVEANVRFGLQVSGRGREETRERAAFWLDKMGLSEFARTYPDQLSGGMRQRVSIARALALEPELLLMDEPFAALDAQLREVLQDELLAIWQSDRRTVLFVTHSLEEAIVLGDRVAVMSARPGQLLRSVEVPFERPRTGELRATPEFGALKSELWDLLKTEVEHASEQRGALRG